MPSARCYPHEDTVPPPTLWTFAAQAQEKCANFTLSSWCMQSSPLCHAFGHLKRALAIQANLLPTTANISSSLDFGTMNEIISSGPKNTHCISNASTRDGGIFHHKRMILRCPCTQSTYITPAFRVKCTKHSHYPNKTVVPFLLASMVTDVKTQFGALNQRRERHSGNYKFVSVTSASQQD